MARAKSALENEQKSATGPIIPLPAENKNTSSNKKISSSNNTVLPDKSKNLEKVPKIGTQKSQSSPITRPTSRRVTSGRVSTSERVTKSSTSDRPKVSTSAHTRVTKASTSERSTANTRVAAKSSTSDTRVTKSSTSDRVSMGNCVKKQSSSTSGAVKKPSKTAVPTAKPLTVTEKKLSRPEVLKEDKKRDESPSSTLVNLSSDSSVSPPPPGDKNETNKNVTRRDTRDMVSPISSPNMSDISDTEEQEILQKSKVKLRSESDGIVVKSAKEKPPVRRCESTDDATDRLLPITEEVPMVPTNAEKPLNNFPQNIKTVASATIVKGPEDITHKIGDTCHFAAHYFGNPEPRVIWIKNGHQLRQEEPRISIKTYSGESSLIGKQSLILLDVVFVKMSMIRTILQLVLNNFTLKNI